MGAVRPMRHFLAEGESLLGDGHRELEPLRFVPAETQVILLLRMFLG